MELVELLVANNCSVRNELFIPVATLIDMCDEVLVLYCSHIHSVNV